MVGQNGIANSKTDVKEETARCTGGGSSVGPGAIRTGTAPGHVRSLFPRLNPLPLFLFPPLFSAYTHDLSPFLCCGVCKTRLVLFPLNRVSTSSHAHFFSVFDCRISKMNSYCASYASSGYFPSRPKVDVAVRDINTFFRILRFLATFPKLAKLSETAETVQQEQPSSTSAAAAPSATQVDADTATPSSGESNKHMAALPHLSQMGVSLSTGNRTVIPPKLAEPLEEYRRVATMPPINDENLEASRLRVRAALEELCAELDDAAVTKALEDDVYAHTDDELVESDASRYWEGRQAITFGPQFSGNKTRISNSNEMQQIVPGLWCGSWRPASKLQVLKSCGITHILCCIESRPHFPSDFVWCQLPAEDSPVYKIEQHFDAAFEYIENAVVREHGGVLVHCGAGISRAPTIVCSYLMRKLNISSATAIQLVQHSRYSATPNMGFREQLHQLGLRLKVDRLTAADRAAAVNAESKQTATTSDPKP
jgi:hypothetical protein